MNSFVDLDFNNYEYQLVVYNNYNISFLKENSSGVRPLLVSIYFNIFNINVHYNPRELCYELWVTKKGTNVVQQVKVIYNLRETLRLTQDLINYYYRFDKLKSFS